MKEIIIHVDDTAFEQFMNFITLCPKVEVVSTNVVAETKALQDKCFEEAISVLRQDMVFRTKGDYGYILQAINDGAVKGLFFYSPLDFVKYMRELGFDQLPGQSTLYDNINKVSGRYPDWEFLDHPDSQEKLRRNNIIVRFMSAFNRAKRRLSEGISENRP